MALLYCVLIDRNNVFGNLVLLPIETLAVQSTFNTLFDISHNGGTWFISCIFICYLLYPYIQKLTKQLQQKGRFILLLLCMFLLLYQPFVVFYFHIDRNYSNPFYRLLEFLIGVLSAAMLGDFQNTKGKRVLRSGIMIGFEVLLLIFAISIAVKLEISPGNYMLYSWAALPIFILLIPGLATAEFRFFKKKKLLYRVVTYLSEISYCFYLSQFFIWDIMRKVGMAESTNWLRCTVAIALCMVLSVAMHELFEKPCKRLLQNKLL